jgi:hypothetical protein
MALHSVSTQSAQSSILAQGDAHIISHAEQVPGIPQGELNRSIDPERLSFLTGCPTTKIEKMTVRRKNIVRNLMYIYLNKTLPVTSASLPLIL